MQLLLVLTILICNIHHLDASDPDCETGVVGTSNDQRICCSASCTTCTECGPGGEFNCCTDIIVLNETSCDDNDPPCILLDISETPNITHSYSHSREYLRIEVTACKDWTYGSTTNSLQIQLKSQYDASPFFFVNDRSLPTHGQTQIYNINPRYYIHNTLQSIVLTMNDAYGYCMKRIAIHSSNDKYYNFGHSYFGMGVMLSNHCHYTYISLSKHRTLFRCIDDHFELYTQRTRGIYKLNLHTCERIDSGISAVDMKQNVYSVIMGKRANVNVYDTTDIEYIDHYAVGELRVNRIGHLIASNILLTDHSVHSNPLYLRHVEGRIIGIKLECADRDRYFTLQDKLMIQMDGKSRHLHSVSVLDMDRYIVGFLRDSDRIEVDRSTEIIIYGDVGYPLYVNVYVILEGFNDRYQLPFVVGHSGMNWFDANQRCMDFYGDEHSAWIGLVDFDVNNDAMHCDWLWVDRSFIDYTQWDMSTKQSHDGNDCAVINGKHGSWSASDCEKGHKFVCGSPQWYSSQKRKLEVNVADRIDQIGIVSIGNDDSECALCIDSISLDYETPIDITNSWIGGDSTDSVLRAVFRAPVCKTEVIELKVLYDTAVSVVAVPARVTVPQWCENAGRGNKVICDAERPQALGTFAIFRLPHEEMIASYTSWASVSNVTLSTQQQTSIATTNELYFDKRFPVHYVTNFANGSYQINEYLFALGPRHELGEPYDIYEKEDTEDTEEDTELVFGGQRWEFSPLQASKCSSRAEVPPSHLLPFYTYISGILNKVTVVVDLKLTLCPEFVNEKEENLDSHFVYVAGVHAQVEYLVAIGCQVVWGIPQYMKNRMTCAQEMQLAISRGSKSVYLPRCNVNNSSLYDACQCRLGHEDLRTLCWCVDPFGDKINGKAMYVDDGATWQQTCTIHLNCSNTQI
eukprot:1013382_1